MVAISLYKGNLHRVSGVDRQWPMPDRKISLNTFRELTRRRSDAAFSRRHPAPPSNPNPNPAPAAKGKTEEGGKNAKNEDLEREEKKEEEGTNGKLSESEGRLGKLTVDVKKENFVVENEEGKSHAEIQKSNKLDNMVEKEKRKKEIEEKLVVLKQRKHNLVQALKQILNAEETLKKHTSQGMAGRPSPLQVDTTADSGSMTRVNTPRVASDGTPIADKDGREADEASKQNIHSRTLLRMSSTSLSSESQQRKAPSIMTAHAVRATQGIANSPLRVATAVQQGPSSNPLSASVSGTNYVASSPSPAGSGGTSVFRDGRLPSPWN